MSDSEVRSELKYSKSHEWVRVEEDNHVTIGITDHAQGALGDMVYVDLPEVGDNLTVDGECGVVESVKAASDLYSPLDGEVVAVNGELADAPEKLNQEPYEGGWILRAQISDPSQLDELMDANAYQAFLESE